MFSIENNHPSASRNSGWGGGGGTAFSIEKRRPEASRRVGEEGAGEMLFRIENTRPSTSTSIPTCRVFAADGNASELPSALAATRAKSPEAIPPTVKLSVADVPDEFTRTVPIAIAGGDSAGTNENVAPVRFTPVTWKPAMTAPGVVEPGNTDVMTGIGTAV